jgi:hypothetical protein
VLSATHDLHAEALMRWKRIKYALQANATMDPWKPNSAVYSIRRTEIPVLIHPLLEAGPFSPVCGSYSFRNWRFTKERHDNEAWHRKARIQASALLTLSFGWKKIQRGTEKLPSPNFHVIRQLRDCAATCFGAASALHKDSRVVKVCSLGTTTTVTCHNKN